MAGTSTNSYTYEDALDEVHTRFILNLPQSELQSSDRIFFQLEQAWWFYDDFLCDNNEELPRFKGLKPFAKKIFEISPLLSPKAAKFDSMWQDFGNYKRKIATYGCAMLNKTMDKIVLCQTFGGKKAWSFPMGKINQGESGLEAAVRETYEETGCDPTRYGILAEKDKIFYNEDGKLRTLYIQVGIPENFSFNPIARKEVSDVKFFPLKGTDIANLKSFAVNPFIPMLKKWVKKKQGDKSSRNTSRSKSRGSNRSSSRSKIVRKGDSEALSGLAKPGDENRWSEDDMFRANEALIGKKVEYNGSPHEFSNSSVDPHRFRVVGGTFLNSGQTKIAPPPESYQLQPLYHREKKEDDDDFTPFFAEDGKSPWDTDAPEVPISKPKKNKEKKAKESIKKSSSANIADGKTADALRFLTDANITARSQANKIGSLCNETAVVPPPTKMFKEFKFDVDKIMRAAFPQSTRYN